MSVSIKLIDGEDPKSLYQYDIGRQIQIITNGGETIKEVQFSNVRLPEALIVLPKLDESGNVIVDVPNIFTLEPRRISVYLITYLENGECVKYKDELNVIPRKKPSDYVYTETEVLNYSLLEKQINSLQSTKLTAPSSAQIGQTFRVQSVNDDGTLTLEAVDMPSGGSGGAVDDVQINGESIVSDGVAEIPIAKENNKFGMVQTSIYDGIIVNNTGYLVLMGASKSDIDRRINYSQGYAITTLGYDYAVKCAMCDGKGAEWTDAEKTGSWSRTTIIKTAIDEVAVAGASYILGELTELSVVLPDDALVGQEVTVAWYNGETPSTLSITGNMLDFDYTPEANTRSEISCLWDGTYWSVIGMSQSVPQTTEEVVASE